MYWGFGKRKSVLDKEHNGVPAQRKTEMLFVLLLLTVLTAVVYILSFYV